MLATEARDRLIVALDLPLADSLVLAREIRGHAGWVKVGMTTFYESGPRAVASMRELGFKVFLDLKLFDIPHQVGGAARATAATGADMLTIHASGGAAMARAARRGAEAAAGQGGRMALLGVTVLTSMDADTLGSVGVSRPLAEQVGALASLAVGSGADGIVCSPLEARSMRELLGPDALIVTPGVRPAGADVGDQSRVATPADAIAAGASHIVVGRPVTQAADPARACDDIVAQLG